MGNLEALRKCLTLDQFKQRLKEAYRVPVRSSNTLFSMLPITGNSVHWVVPLCKIQPVINALYLHGEVNIVS